MRRNPRGDLCVYPRDASQLREFAERAIRRGFYSLCVAPQGRISPEELFAIREEYADRLDVVTVLESQLPRQTDSIFDFQIAQLNTLEVDGMTVPFPKTYADAYAVSRLLGGYEYEVVRVAYNALAELPERTGCDAVRLFDPVALWNTEKRPLFNLESMFCNNAEQTAFKKLSQQNTVIELCVNGKGKGGLPISYPRLQVLRQIAERQGRVALSSRATDPVGLADRFSEAILQLRACGFGSIYIRQKDGWKQLPL